MFRLRRIDPADGAVQDERWENAGVGTLSSPGGFDAACDRERVFEEFLRARLIRFVSGDARALDEASVIISGMASSSVGWRELPYADAPVALDGSGLVHEVFDLALTEGGRARVILVSGVRTENDIMRGEETEIVGIFAGGQYESLARDGILVMPGTHSKHIRVQERRIADFRTYITGELFDVLSKHSLLRASVDSAVPPREERCIGLARDGFIQGVREARQVGLASSLFQVRVRTVLRRVAESINRWYLSGLLIGAELSGLARRGGETPILLAASEPLSSVYQLALESLGLDQRLTVVPPEDTARAAVRGHLAVWSRINPSFPGV